MISLKQAADATGKTKPTILKAIKNGRISANKNEKGEWEIDPAELHRVYKSISVNSSRNSESLRYETPKKDSGLQVEIELLRERIKDKDSVIEDLRRRLDAEAEERRKLTLLLTHEHADKSPQKPTESFRVRLGKWIAGRN